MDTVNDCVLPQDLHVVDTELPDTMEWALYCAFGLVGKLAIICYITPLFLLLLLPIAAVFSYIQVGQR